MPTIPWWSVPQLICLDTNSTNIACDITIYMNIGTLHTILWGALATGVA